MPRGKVPVHGMSGKPEYNTWLLMRRRCQEPQDGAFKHYGAKGVRVCARWQSFENFFADMGLRPGAGFSIDRINGRGNYEPSNCRWATRTEQNNNTSQNIRVAFRGKTLTIAQWARLVGVKARTLYARYHRGWRGRRLLSPVE